MVYKWVKSSVSLFGGEEKFRAHGGRSPSISISPSSYNLAVFHMHCTSFISNAMPEFEKYSDPSRKQRVPLEVSVLYSRNSFKI